MDTFKIVSIFVKNVCACSLKEILSMNKIITKTSLTNLQRGNLDMCCSYLAKFVETLVERITHLFYHKFLCPCINLKLLLLKKSRITELDFSDLFQWVTSYINNA